MQPWELRQIRKRLTWSQSRLAALCGVSTTAVSAWETGLTPIPRLVAVLGLLLWRSKEARTLCAAMLPIDAKVYRRARGTAKQARKPRHKAPPPGEEK